MNKIQKTIKYFAIVLGIYLVVSIFIGLLTLVNDISGLSSKASKDDNYYKTYNLNNNLNLDIDLHYSNLKIMTANEYKIETNNSDLKIDESNDTIYIKDTKNIFNRKDHNIILYIPDEKNIDTVKIDTGAGKIDISKLKTNNLFLNLGAGVVEIQSLTVNNLTNIDTGAGSLNIADSQLHNLDLDMGVGDVVINSILSGNCEIDAGVGSLEINLLDSQDNYTFDINKGIGNILFNDNNIRSSIVGNGLNKIIIDGGLGNIKIATVN